MTIAHADCVDPHSPIAPANSDTDSNIFTADEYNTLGNVTIAMATLSFCGSLLICLIYVFVKRLRKSSHQIFWVSVTDLLSCVGYFIGDRAITRCMEGLCHFQAFWIQFFSLASVLWTSCLAFNLYVRVMKQQSDTRKLERNFHLFVWPFTFLFSLLPFSTRNYGNAGYICWIDSSTEKEADSGTLWRYFAFFLWVWLAMGFNSIVYIKVVRFVRRVMTIEGLELSEEHKKKLSVVNRFKLYPIILIITWTFPTINRLHQSVNPKNGSYGLFLLAAIFSPLQGFFNVAVYSFTGNVRGEIKKFLKGGNSSDLEIEANASPGIPSPPGATRSV